MSRCLALLLAVLLLFPPEADLADTLQGRDAGGGRGRSPRRVSAPSRAARGGWSPVEVCLSGEGFGRGPLVLLRSDGGEVRCFTLRRRRPALPRRFLPVLFRRPAARRTGPGCRNRSFFCFSCFIPPDFDKGLVPAALFRYNRLLASNPGQTHPITEKAVSKS